jgi:hypothetical protein
MRFQAASTNYKPIILYRHSNNSHTCLVQCTLNFITSLGFSYSVRGRKIGSNATGKLHITKRGFFTYFLPPPPKFTSAAAVIIGNIMDNKAMRLETKQLLIHKIIYIKSLITFKIYFRCSST